MTHTVHRAEFDSLVASLSAVHPGQLLAAAVARLSEPQDWAAAVAAYLHAMPVSRFVDLNRDCLTPEEIQPSFFVLAGLPGGGRVLLNHFDRPAYERAVAEGRIGLHGHYYDFASRVLCGGFKQLICAAEPAGNGDPPRVRELECREGTVYRLGRHEKHMVLYPQHGTVTLFIRGPLVADPGHRFVPADEVNVGRRVRSYQRALASAVSTRQAGE